MDVTQMATSEDAARAMEQANALPPEIAAYEDEQDPAVRGPWQIETLGSADWALCRLAECEAEAHAIEAQAEAAVERIRKRAADLVARARRGAGFFRFKLVEYAERRRGELLKGTRKSHDFVHGRIGWRKSGGRLKVVDKDALSAWLLTQPVEGGLYRVRVEPEMRALQAAAKQDGVLPPGCEYEPEHDEIHVQAVDPAALPAPGKEE